MFASMASNGGLHQAILTAAIPFMTEAVRAWCSLCDCRHALALWVLEPASLDVPQSESAFGSAFEGALYGFRPMLFPFPPGIALVGSFAGAISLS